MAEKAQAAAEGARETAEAALAEARAAAEQERAAHAAALADAQAAAAAAETAAPDGAAAGEGAAAELQAVQQRLQELEATVGGQGGLQRSARKHMFVFGEWPCLLSLPASVACPTFPAHHPASPIHAPLPHRWQRWRQRKHG